MSKSKRWAGTRQIVTREFLRQINEHVAGEASVREINLADEVGALEQLGRSVRVAIPLLKGRLRLDTVVVIEIPIAYRNIPPKKIVATHPYSGDILLPPEYSYFVDGRLPCAAICKRGFLGMGGWETSSEKQDDFSRHLEAHDDRPRVSLWQDEWEQSKGRSRIKLDWTAQLIPTSETRYFVVHKYPYQESMWTGYKFYFDGVLSFAKWLPMTVESFEQGGDKAAVEIIRPSISLLTNSEFLDLKANSKAPDESQGNL